MILNCKKFEYGLCPICDKRRPVSEQDGLCWGCGGHAGYPNYFKEICCNCGCTYGAHHGGTSPWPRDYCPGTEGRMDWENGPGRTFCSSGKFKP